MSSGIERKEAAEGGNNSWRSGSLPCNQQYQWVSGDFPAQPPTYPRASLTEIRAVRRELLAWMGRQPGRGHAKRVLLSLEYCIWNPGEFLGERELAKDVSALATAVGR